METIETLMRSRMDWIDVGVVENRHVDYEHSTTGAPGTDFDVVIRIDGAYASEEDAQVIAAFFRGRLAAVGLLKPRITFVKDLTDQPGDKLPARRGRR